MMAVTKTLLAILVIGAFCTVQPASAQARKLTQKRLAKLESKNAAPANDAQQNAPENNANKNAKPNQPVPPRLQALVLDRFLDRLELAPEQKMKLREVRLLHFRQARSLIELERAQTKVYDDVLYSNEFDEKAIEKRAGELAETRGEVIKIQARLFIEVRKILTPEQFARLRQMVEDERVMRQKNALP